MNFFRPIGGDNHQAEIHPIKIVVGREQPVKNQYCAGAAIQSAWPKGSILLMPSKDVTTIASKPYFFVDVLRTGKYDNRPSLVAHTGRYSVDMDCVDIGFPSALCTHLCSFDILDGLRDEGFGITMVMQTKSRIKDRQAFTKHLLRFRKIEDLGVAKPDVHEIVLINSHDGTSAYQLMSGIFRCICSNGLITGDFSHSLKVYHKGNIAERVIDSTLKIVEEAPTIMATIDEMKQIMLSRDEQLLLSQYFMMALATGDEEEEGKFVYQPQDFLRVRRFEDNAKDLYSTVNVIQENVMKGGISRRDAKGRKHTTRGVTNIYNSVKINTLLWRFAEEMKQIKS